MSSGKFKQVTSIHLLEGPKSRTPVTSNAGKNVDQQEPSFVADVNAK